MRRITYKPNVLSVDSIVRAVLCLYFIISIFEPYLNGILGSVTKFYMFFVMFVLLWKDNLHLKLQRVTIAYIIWLAYKIFTLLWSEDFATPQLHFVSQVGMVMYLAVLLSVEQDRKTLDSIKDIYWLSSIVLGVLSILFSKAYHGSIEARQVLVIMGVEVDPNNQAALLLVGVAISAANILYEKRRFIPSVIGLVINIYACFGTASRGGLVTLVAILAFCVLYSASDKKKITDFVYRLVLLVIGIGTVYYITVEYLSAESFERLFDFESYEGGSDREILWRKTWEVYTRDPLSVLIGAGWGTVMFYIGGKAVHNTFLSMLCDVGLIGTLLFMLPLIIVAVKMLRKKQPMPVLLLVAQFIPAFFIDAINKRFFWNAIIMLFMYYMAAQKDMSEEHPDQIIKYQE